MQEPTAWMRWMAACILARTGEWTTNKAPCYFNGSSRSRAWISERSWLMEPVRRDQEEPRRGKVDSVDTKVKGTRTTSWVSQAHLIADPQSNSLGSGAAFIAATIAHPSVKRNQGVQEAYVNIWENIYKNSAATIIFRKRSWKTPIN